MNQRKNILIAPLEWGLGHATRMIPIAKQLSGMGHSVFVAAGESHLALFRSEVPELQFIDFKGFKPGYSRWFPQYLWMLMKTPALLYYIISDHYRLKGIVKKYCIDIVISDNRFGLWNRNVKSIYITHMPRIPLPPFFKILENAGVMLHRIIIEQYDKCFIPDVPGKTNLSGRLSHDVRLPGNVSYMGILSRFQVEQPSVELQFSMPYDTVVLSGPEPQRGIFREKILQKLSVTGKLTIIFEGKPESGRNTRRDGNFIFYNHLDAANMSLILQNSDLVISRSGYTTIMDLVYLGKTGLLIPTPGQTEQEYLGEYHNAKGWFQCVEQKNIKSYKIRKVDESGSPVMIVTESRKLFEAALRNILE